MGSARRFWQVAWSPRLTSSGFSPADIGVFTEPGATQFTRIFWVSFAAVRDRPMTAALLAQYGDTPGDPICPNVLAAETLINTVVRCIMPGRSMVSTHNTSPGIHSPQLCPKTEKDPSCVHGEIEIPCLIRYLRDRLGGTDDARHVHCAV